MNQKVNQKYADKVVSMIPVSKNYKSRIKEDILSRLEEYHGVEDPVAILGKPENVAKEFIENIDPSEIKPLNSGYLKSNFQYSYRSDKTFMGLPLVDIQFGNRKIAKGIIAMGDFAVGVFAVGAISLGGISLGAISLGLLALGGAALSLICSIGGIAISGILSIGGMAVAYECAVGGIAVAHTLAIGGYASASNIAMGDIAHGNLALYKTSFKGEIGVNYISTTFEQFKMQVQKLYPNFSKTLLSIIDFGYHTIMLSSKANS